MGTPFLRTGPLTAAHASALALVLLGSGVAKTAIPRAEPFVADHQWQALGLAPLSGGGRTGLKLDASEAVAPIAVAPERARLELTMFLAGGEPIGALLERAGVSRGDAVAANALVASAGARVAPATMVEVGLGARAPDGRRALSRAFLRAGLGLNLEVTRDAAGALQLVRHELKVDTTPLRIRGRAGDGLYWSLRSAGATPQGAAEYLKALATQIDVGSEIAPDDRFDLVIARRAAAGSEQAGPLLYAGLDRSMADDVQLVRWRQGSRLEWINPGDFGRQEQSAMAWPAEGRITSGFGYRVHPILRFKRLHRGVDFGAAWGSPIVAAADGQVTMAGWAGGYGRQVRIAHGDGLATSYSHMSSIAAEAGSIVRRGQVIGYVGSSGLSTGPHLHYEVYRGGVPVNPLSVRFAGGGFVDQRQANAVKARLKQLLAVGSKRA